MKTYSQFITELSKATINSYQKKAHAQANNILKTSLDDVPKSVEKAAKHGLERRKKGLKMAYKKVGMPEGFQIDEISKKKAGDYMVAAQQKLQHHDKELKKVYGAKTDKEYEKHGGDKAVKHHDDAIKKRMRGVNTARKKMLGTAKVGFTGSDKAVDHVSGVMKKRGY